MEKRDSFVLTVISPFPFFRCEGKDPYTPTYFFAASANILFLLPNPPPSKPKNSDEDDDDMSMGNVAKQQRLLQKLLASFVDDDEESLGPSTLDSVLRVYCTHVEPSFSTPWQRGQQYSSTSTGKACGHRCDFGVGRGGCKESKCGHLCFLCLC